MSTDAVVVVAHGSVDALSDLPEFLKNIRRGNPAPPEMLAEMRRRYEAIGGSSPLNGINRELACKLQSRLGVPVRLANRYFRPYPRDVLAELFESGVRRVAAVPLAQHSAGDYGAAMHEAARAVGNGSLAIVSASNWGQDPALTDLFAAQIEETLERIPSGNRSRTALVMTAHSLPLSVIQAGDPYEQEFRRSAEAVVGRLAARVAFSDHAVAFQSQGMSTRPTTWLGPDLRSTLESFAASGKKHVVLAPIGFLADHVEILYDLDIEASAWAAELGITLSRSASLNDKSELISILAALANTLLERK
ncbi:MAG: ferrochelatase [Polyangiaceae bacterium]|nr:ferrochelatase [Polyangiaceae bacterium]